MAILLEIYAKCPDGQDAIAKRRIEEALGDPARRVTKDGGLGKSHPESRTKELVASALR